MRKRNRQRGSAAASVHDSSLIRCRGNVDKRSKNAAREQGRGVSVPRSQASSPPLQAGGFSDRAKYWSEWQYLNLRPPRPERGASTISKRKSPEATPCC